MRSSAQFLSDLQPVIDRIAGGPMHADSKLHEYIKGLLRHGYGESWLPDLTLEQVAAIAALANQELMVRIKEAA